MSDDTIDLDAIVANLTARGLAAYVEHTGGGCATVYAAADAETLDFSQTDAGYGQGLVILAGPGWFDGPNWTLGRAALGEFYIGPDDFGESAPTTTHTADPAAIADAMAAAVAALPARTARDDANVVGHRLPYTGQEGV